MTIIAGKVVLSIGLGAMPLSLEGRPSDHEAIWVVHQGLDAGISVIDTADTYCLGDEELGHNERLIARALRTWAGPQPFVMTKGGVTRPGGGWGHDATPNGLRAACNRSLRALGIERIWLYQLHALDPMVPIEESIGALDELRREGKIEHMGLSNVEVSELERARTVGPIASVQNRASIFYPQGLTDGTLAYCEREGITFIAHSPLGGGNARHISHHQLLRRLGNEAGYTPHQVALAWLLGKSNLLIAIPGASHAANARSSAAAANIALSPAAEGQLDLAFLT